MDRLKANYDTITALQRENDSGSGRHRAQSEHAARMIRVLTVLREYVAECDDAHGEERAILPLGRLVVRFYLASYYSMPLFILLSHSHQIQ